MSSWKAKPGPYSGLHVCLNSGWYYNVVGTLFPIRIRPVNERMRSGEVSGEEQGRGHGEERAEKWRNGGRKQKRTKERPNTAWTGFGCFLSGNVPSRSVSRGKSNTEKGDTAQGKILCDGRFCCLVIPCLKGSGGLTSFRKLIKFRGSGNSQNLQDSESP